MADQDPGTTTDPAVEARVRVDRDGWDRERHMIPDPAKTPGVLCTPGDPDFQAYRYAEHIAMCKRNIGEDEKNQVAALYGIPKSDWKEYEFDHLIPLSAGGSNSPQNLFPQQLGAAQEKDQLEWDIHDRLEQGTVKQADAVKEIHDWRPSATPGYGKPFEALGAKAYQPQNALEAQVMEERRASGWPGDWHPRSHVPANGVPADRQYVEPEGFVGRALNALDYPGNAFRSFLAGVMENHGDLAPGGQYALQALKKQRETTPTQVKDDFTQDVGLGKVRFGKDDGKFQWGDVADIGLDMGVAVGTDPLNMLSMGYGALTKEGGVLAKGAAEYAAGKAASRQARAMEQLEEASKLGSFADVDKAGLSGEQVAKLDELSRQARAAGGIKSDALDAAREAVKKFDTPDAARYAQISTLARAGLGGALGYGEIESDAPWWEKAIGAGAGAALGVKMPQMLEAGRAAVKDTADTLYNAYAVATRGVGFDGVSEAKSLANHALERAKGIAQWIVNGRNAALDGLDPMEKAAAVETMHELKNASVKYRTEALEKFSLEPGMPQYEAAFNGLTNEANDYVTNEVMPKVLADKFGKDPEAYKKMVVAINNWADHNENVVGRLNQEVLGMDPARSRSGGSFGIPGLRYHVDDVRELTQGKLVDNAVRTWQIHAARLGETAEDAAKAGLSADESYAVYANRFSKAFLDREEQQAISLAGNYAATPARQGVVRGWEKGLKGFDQMTSFMKAGMLYFSGSWLRTQLFDNWSKAFTEGGTGSLMKAMADSTFGSVTNDVGQDVRALLRGDISHVFTNEDVQEALAHGAVHTDMVRALSNEVTNAFMQRPKALGGNGKGVEQLKNISDGDLLSAYRRGATWLLEKNPVVGLVRSVGSYMEAAARMSTFSRTKAGLLAQGVSGDMAAQVAAETVTKTFFNYSDVTAMERAVMQRLMPFYAFYSKNLPYWARAVFDPEKIGRVAALDKMRQVLGHTPSKQDMMGMTPYVADNAPRAMGKDDQGNKRYVVSSVDPRVEALKMVDPRRVLDTLKERGNALLKVPYELATGKDTFTDDALYPSQTKDGKKYLYGRGFKWEGLNRGAEALGLGRPLPVDVDRRGNPYSTSDAFVGADKALQALLPMGAMEQLAGGLGKGAYGRQAYGVGALNAANPYQTVSISPALERMARARNQEKEGARGKANGDKGGR